MTIPLILLALVAGGALFFYRVISQSKELKINTLSKQKQKYQSKYEYLVRKKNELKAELAEKERQLATLRNSQEGIKTYTAADLDISEESETEKISRFLISSGKISMEQNEKAMKKMAVLKMDFLATCMALGFIDLETSQKVMKASKGSSHLKV